MKIYLGLYQAPALMGVSGIRPDWTAIQHYCVETMLGRLWTTAWPQLAAQLTARFEGALNKSLSSTRRFNFIREAVESLQVVLERDFRLQASAEMEDVWKQVSSMLEEALGKAFSVVGQFEPEIDVRVGTLVNHRFGPAGHHPDSVQFQFDGTAAGNLRCDVTIGPELMRKGG